VTTSLLATSLPLVAAVVYALSALYLKQATMEGGGLWRITFLTTWGQALLLFPLVFLGNGPLSETNWSHVFWTAFVFYVGQLCVFAGMRFGDVSVVTPVMGVKVLLVAVLVVLATHEALPAVWWAAAGLSTAAALLLGGGNPSGTRGLLPGLLGGLGAALAFAGVDVFFQLWADGPGVWRFSALVALFMGVFSFSLLPFLEGPALGLPGGALRAFVPGLLGTIAQVLLMAYCVVKLNGAAWANLLYSSRGVWSVLLVWKAGRLFDNNENEIGRAGMVRRLLGSGLMLAAIALVLL
jgi:drug/metabolite transporter (DMT)-like permease